MPHLTPSSAPFSFLQRALPYLILGIAFTLGLGLVVLLALVTLVGSMVGLLYYGIHHIIQRYRPGKASNPHQDPSSQGRIIEHDDL